MSVDQCQLFQLEEQMNDNNKQNCLELNNIPLSMREHTIKGFHNRQASAMTTKSNFNRKRQQSFGINNNEKISNFFLNSNLVLNSNQQQSPYSMFTPLSLLEQYNSATINPFLCHHEQKQQQQYGKDQKEDAEQSQLFSQQSPKLSRQQEAKQSSNGCIQEQQQKTGQNDKENQHELEVIEIHQAQNIDEEIQIIAQPSTQNNKTVILSPSLVKSKQSQKQQNQIQQLSQQQHQKQQDYLVLSRITSPKPKQHKQYLNKQQSLSKSISIKKKVLPLQIQKNQQDQQDNGQTLALIDICDNIENAVMLIKHTNVSSLKITLGDIVSFVAQEYELKRPIIQLSKNKNVVINCLYQKNNQFLKNVPRQSVSSIPRKSISLFSRMMKPQGQLHPPQNYQPPTPSPLTNHHKQQLYLLTQKHTSLSTFIQHFTHQNNNNDSQILVRVINHKLSNAFCREARTQQPYQLEIIHSCEYLRDQQNENDQNSNEQDDQWSSKYITSRRHQTSREVDHQSKLSKNVKNNQLTSDNYNNPLITFSTDQISLTKSRLKIFAFLIKSIISHYAQMININFQQCQQSFSLSHQDITLFIHMISSNSQFSHQYLQTHNNLLTPQMTKQFNHLVYKVWLRSIPTKDQISLQYCDFMFDSVFQLLNSSEENVMFLFFLIKLLQLSYEREIHSEHQQSLLPYSYKDLKTIRNPTIPQYTDRIHHKKTIKQQQFTSSKRQEIQLDKRDIKNVKIDQIRDVKQQSKNLWSQFNKKKSAKTLNSPQNLITLNNASLTLKKSSSTSHLSTMMKHSRNPQLHKQHLQMLHLEKSLKQKQTQLQRKQNLIKRLLLINELQEIQHEISTKNQQVILDNKLQTVRETYRSKIIDQQKHIMELQHQVLSHNRTAQSIHTERNLQAKLLQENHHLHIMKKHTLSSTARLTILKHKNQ